MDITLDGSKEDRSAIACFTSLHERFEKSDCALHDFSRLKDKGKLHLPFAEEFPDCLHAFKKMVVDDRQWSDTRAHREL